MTTTGPAGAPAASDLATHLAARTAPAAPSPRPRPTNVSPWQILEKYGLLVLLVALVTFFALHPTSGEAFTSLANIRAVLGNQAVGLVVALALLLPFAAGFFDFSVGATTAAASVVAATLMSRFGQPLWVALVAGVLSGVLVGLVNGFLVAYLQTNPFIATLGVATLLGGAVFAYTGGLQITNGISPDLTAVGSATWFGLPRVVIVAVVLAGAVWFVMAQTVFGRMVATVGSNPAAARLVGIDVRRTQLQAFGVAGLLGGIAGVLLLARQGAATSDNGMSMLFPALTAVLLGTIVIDIGRPSVPGTVIGILFVGSASVGWCSSAHLHG